jgi:hypothetical protein
MSDRPDADGGTERSAALMQRLGRRRLQARAVLLFELVWPALWPALGVLGAFVCVALLDVPRMLPAVVHVAALAAATALFGWLLLRGLRRVRIPDAAEADRRLERASGLRHRPLSVLTDRPALPGADALWSAHFARAAAQVGRLRVWWWRWRPVWASPVPRHRRACCAAWCRASPRLPRPAPPNCRRGSRRPAIPTWLRCSCVPTAARCRCRRARI